MESSILKQIARFLQEQKKQKRWLVVFLCLAIIVGFGTVTALKMRGQAMTHKEKRVICQLAVHQHADECYDENKENLICGYADYVVHVHNEDCYDWNGNLTCQLPEVEKHEHSEECYTEESTLICGLEETAGHQHGAECYTTQQGGLICQVPEHTHAAECYDETGAVICGLEEHIHEDACYEWTDVLICQLAEGADGHTHTEACYEVKEILSCGKLELHTHTDACYEKINEEEELSETNRRLVCTIPVLEEHIHTEDAGCLETVEVTANGELVEEGTVEEETTEGETEEEIFTTDLDGEEAEEEDGKSEADAEEEETETADDAGEEDTESSETDGEADGDEAEGAEEGNASYETVKTFVGEGYKVTASYNEDANIPEEAELIAEQITVDTDEEHYTKREAQYRKTTGEKDAVMKALFKIGFYIEGKEIEPETPVNLTIQFLDEKGLPEGAPITVVHFADKGTEVLDGSEAEGGSTSFDMNSFSEVAIGYKRADAETASVSVSNSYEYESSVFHFIFHVEGKAKILEDIVLEEGNGEALPSVGGEDSGTPDESGDVSESEIPDDTESADTSEETEDFVGEEESGSEEAEDGAESEESTEMEESEGSEESGDITEDGAVEEDGDSAGSGEETDSDGSVDVPTDDVPEASGDERFEFRVEHLEKDSKEYQAVVNNAALTNRGSELLYVQTLSYGMYCDGKKLDLSECEVTVDVKAVEPLSRQIEVSVPTAISYLRETGSVSEDTAPKEEDQYQTEVAVEVVGISDATSVNKVDRTVLSEEKPNDTLSFEAPTVFAAQASGMPNPKFKVQYYANLEKVAYNDPKLTESVDGTNTNELPVIDTDGGKLPGNGKGAENSPNGNKIRKLYVDTKSGKLKTKTELTEVYAERNFEYLKAPTINYINAVIESPSYELKEVWVLEAGKDPESTERNDWKTYSYNKNLHFTNRALSDGIEDGETYVHIADNATIRLVYNTTTMDRDFEAAFYDYDIGDGEIYSTLEQAKSGKGGKPTSTQGTTETWYMRTGQQGINNPENYTDSGTKFAFGNTNTGSGLPYEQWNGNLLNKNNSTQKSQPVVTGSYKGCTFGLAASLVNGEIQYADGIIVPNLFNEGNAIGKTAYDNNEYSLRFKRVGDTHTLTTVNDAGTSNLDSFNHPKPNDSTVHNHIWTNNFWPMDLAASFGTDGHDMKFGDYDRTKGEKYKFAGQAGIGAEGAPATGNLPPSDDGKDHNSFFGMHYKVEFDLVADYTGPLEYYFFGDDDMWVFLGDGDGNGELVCDIGGVHSSVGEYLNLWDYIDKEDEKIHRHEEKCYNEKNEVICGYVDQKSFTLNFFYTERGESGSTCWMQFTLPSVSSITPETTKDDYGHLEVRKDVKVKLNDKEYEPEELFEGKEQLEYFGQKDFTFKISLKGPSGSSLKDDYAYIKYDKNGKPISSGAGGSGILQWETIANGETFTLKDGEHISIRYLPVGTKYTITEEDGTEIQGVVYDSTTVSGDGEISNGLEVTGDIAANSTKKVAYVNLYTAYELPKTGGSGIIVYTIAGVLVIMLGAGFMYRKKVRERRV